MHFSIKLKLKWKLLGGFLLCAIITGIIVALGVFSSIRIKSGLKAGLDDKMGRIEIQNARIKNLIPLRGLVIKIMKATDEDGLSEAAQIIESMKARDKKDRMDGFASILELFDALLAHKRDQIAALEKMNSIQNDISNVLDKLETIVTNISDTVEYHSTISIENTVSSSDKEFKKAMETTGHLFSIIESSAGVRTDITKVNVLLKDAIITDSNDVLNEIQTELDILFQHIDTELAKMPEKMLTEEIQITLSDFHAAASIIIAAKRKLMASAAYRETSTGNELKTLFYAINNDFQKLTGLIGKAGEGLKSDSEIKYQENVARIRKHFEKIALIVNEAMVGTKSAYRIKSSSNKLKAEIRKVFLANDETQLEKMKKDISLTIQSIEQDAFWLPENDYQNALSETRTRIKSLSGELFDGKTRMLGVASDLESFSADIMERMSHVDDSILSAARDIQTNAVQTMEVSDHLIARSISIQIMIGCIVFLAGVILGLAITRSISGSINQIIRRLSGSSNDIFSAVDQLSSSSRTLADLSENQVAAAEEASASLEQMASMTRQNADNADNAASLTDEAESYVNQAYESMNTLTASMSEITRAGEETAGIVKNIDEIAFQTNLLALNAAVEAARAGESGAGFAVVAEEVRNLAMRAADASRNTAVRIQQTVEKVKDGANLVNSAHAQFSKMTEKTSAVRALVEEIASASKDQAIGIEQMNRAVADIERAVQENASAARNTASASDAMHMQARELNAIVSELKIMIDGKKGVSSNKLPTPVE